MSMIQEAIAQYQRRVDEQRAESGKNKQRIDEDNKASLIFAGIHQEGIAVVEQYVKPFSERPETLAEHLRALNRRFNPFASKDESRLMYIPVQSRSKEQPAIDIRLEGVRRRNSREELRVNIVVNSYVEDVRERLVTETVCTLKYPTLTPLKTD